MEYQLFTAACLTAMEDMLLLMANPFQASIVRLGDACSLKNSVSHIFRNTITDSCLRFFSRSQCVYVCASISSQAIWVLPHGDVFVKLDLACYLIHYLQRNLPSHWFHLDPYWICLSMKYVSCDKVSNISNASWNASKRRIYVFFHLYLFSNETHLASWDAEDEK